MEKISWVDRVSNDEVLQRVQESRNILDTVQQHKLRWIGHILRHDSLLLGHNAGQDVGQSNDRRKCLQMLSNITSKDSVTLKRDAEDRNSWRKSLS